jgi:tetratricopeptide (TPR) repeat protein
MGIQRKDIVLLEDHNEALKIWRRKKVKNLDLVHIDAHIDFSFHQVRPIEEIFKEARSLKELKQGLERNIAFRWYEKDIDKQTNIGNYIYPAIKEGIVKDFYWVVPGGLKEFKQSVRFIKSTINNLTKQSKEEQRVKQIKPQIKDGLIKAKLLNRDFIICVLEKLPVLKQNILLDIDTDFLVIDSILNADNTIRIGKRKPWLLPQELVRILENKARHCKIITIAYSVNGGYTPIKYKYLGDEIAYYLAPKDFKRRFERNYQAAKYFNLFISSEKKEYYQKAVRLNPTYRVTDNNYGPLYLGIRKFSFAKEEFLKIFRVDSENPGCLLGLGNIALERSDFKKAKKYFFCVLNSKNNKLFAKEKKQSLLGLARAEFGLKNFKKAKELLIRYRTIEPLQPHSYYLLGRVLEKEREFSKASLLYQDAIRLGITGIEPIWRLLRISYNLEQKDTIVKYVIIKYKQFKTGFIKTKKLILKKGKRIKNLHKIERRMTEVEKGLALR